MLLLSCLLAALSVCATDTTKKGLVITPKVDDGQLIICGFEVPPTFPGGEEVLTRYLEKNVKYPVGALKAKVSGTVFIQFSVDRTGGISNIHPVGPKKGYGLEEEAVRVISSMPKWKPGKVEGKAIDVYFNLPIRFVLPTPTNNGKPH